MSLTLSAADLPLEYMKNGTNVQIVLRQKHIPNDQFSMKIFHHTNLETPSIPMKDYTIDLSEQRSFNAPELS